MSQTPTAAPRATKVIKRYANRKLYDTERSCYVTLEEISQMIKDGDDVRVVDNKTKDDLTAVTLAQIIVEEEKKVQKMPLKLLRSIIQSGNDAIAQLDVTKAATNLRHDVEQRVQQLWKRDGKKDDGAVDVDADKADKAGEKAGERAGDPKTEKPSEASAADEAVKNGVIQEFVHSTTEAFESWQKRVDERIQTATAKSPKPTTDIETLKKRVEELEAKLALLEAGKKC